jgi:hypothetical protein
MSDVIIVAIITGVLSLAGTLAGSYFSQKKTTALVVYRLEQLEKKVDKHNQVIERTFQLEKRCDLFDEKIKVANNRIKDLERVSSNADLKNP